MYPERLLIAEDEEDLRWALEKLFRGKGLEVVGVADGKEAWQALEDPSLGVALIDIRLPRVDGLKLLARAREVNPELRVIIMTAHTGMESALEAMRMGAYDYLPKPFELKEVEAVVDKALSAKSLYQELLALRERLKEGRGAGRGLIGKSRAMLELFKLMGKVSQGEATVLICGESGTGKELIARTIHGYSPRFSKPFVAVNCAAIPKELLEAEIFGFERGAFTGAVESKRGRLSQAEGGTLFLDEIGDLPLELQGKLLRVLEEREFQPLGAPRPIRFNVRFMAATNQNLEEKVARREFRRDLFYRINVVTLHVPPLRERREDIPLLVEHFVRRFEEEFGVSPRSFSPQAMNLLLNHPWLGNVRELENTVKRALILSTNPVIGPDDLSLALEGKVRFPSGVEMGLTEWLRQNLSPLLDNIGAIPRGGIYDMMLRLIEPPLLELVLEKAGGNKVRAAKMLGINRNTLDKKLRCYEISASKFKEGR